MASDAELACIGASLARVSSDLARATRLAGDARQQLFATFTRLSTHLAEERLRYETAIDAITGGTDDRGLVGVVRDVLAAVASDIASVGERSVRILVEVDALRGHADAVSTRGRRIERIAQTSRVISLNARIEAHRIGEGGDVFRVVAEEIKALADESGELSRAIRAAIEAQARSLAATNAVANELGSTDLTLAVDRHELLETTIAKLEQASRTATTALDQIQQDIDAALHALHVEDRLENLLSTIARKVAAIQAACAGPADVTALADLAMEIERDAHG